MAHASFEPVLSARPSMKMRWPRYTGLRLRAYGPAVNSRSVGPSKPRPPARGSRVRSLARSAGVCCWISGFRVLAVAQQAYPLRQGNEPFCAVFSTTRFIKVEVYEDQFDRAFMALADPVRRAIVARLSRSDATLNELAEPFVLTKQAISKHIHVPEQAGLVTKSGDARRKLVYLDPPPSSD